MAITCRNLILVFALGSLVEPALQAQTQPGPPDVVNAEFTVFAQHRLNGLYYLPKPGAEPAPLEFFTQTRSALYRYRGPSVLCFYDKASLRALADRPDAPRPVAEAVLGPTNKRTLIIFFPLPVPLSDGRKYAVRVLEDSNDALPVGHAVVYNASGKDYIAEFGNRRVMLLEGLSEIVPASGRIRLKLAARFNERWLRAGSHELNLAENARACVVLFPPASPSGLSPQLRVLIEEFTGDELRRTATK